MAVWKLLCLVTLCMSGLLTLWIAFPKLTAAQRALRVCAWAQDVLRVLSVELIVIGQQHAPGPLMLVANHTSWLDITALHASGFSRFIAKHELRRWPGIGFMAAQAGTLFLERHSRRDAFRVVHQIAQCLQDGEVVAVFPEGTTGEGKTLLPFHGNLLQAAIAVDAPVQPVSIQYVDARSGLPSNAANYVGDVHFLVSLWSTLCSQHLAVQVQFGPPQWASGRTRRIWAGDLHTAVSQMRQPSARNP